MGYYLQGLFNSSFYITGFLICLCCLIYTHIQGHISRTHNRFFIFLMFDVMLNALACIVNDYTTPIAARDTVAAFFQNVACFVYFSTHSALGPMFYVYLIYATGSIYRHRRKKVRFSLLMVPFMLMEIAVIMNFQNHWLFYLDADRVYHRQNGMYLIYAISAYYFFMAIAESLLYWRVSTKRRRSGMMYMLIITLVGILIQMIFPKLEVEVFSESLALLGVMLFIEDEDDRIDATCRLYNRVALMQDLNSLFMMKQFFDLIVVHIYNPGMLNKVTGNISKEELPKSVGSYLKNLNRNYEVYRISLNTFALTNVRTDTENNTDLLTTIRKRFTEPWDYEGVEINLNVLIMQASYPDEIESMEDVLRMTDAATGVITDTRVLRGGELDYLSREAEISLALRRGFQEHSYEVYYQPVYFLENMSIHAAEALIRLHDEKLGDIPPAEFIPVAERDGIIDEIGNFVLEEACMFLSSGLPGQMGIEYISVNLSVVQCMRSGFAAFAKDLTARYDIAPSLISFEIKESTAVGDLPLLLNAIRSLRNYGFRFSMDSYGTGFSDMHALYALDFDVIKIDRSILNRAEDKVGRIVLESCVRMIREMKRRILVEGVETKEQIDLLKRLEVDYVQGYYSSKPITKNELLGILRVTELARMEEQRANAASEAKSSFLANMSHEIRTPINAVLGMNEMIQRECDEPAIMEYAKEIEIAGRNLLSLVNNILDYSKIEAGEMEIVEAEYDLKKALSDVIRSTYRKTQDKQLSFRVNISDELPARLFGDEYRLKQILTNLLNNAVKYTQEGGVRLVMSCEPYSDEEIVLSIDVEDTGCGIREEDQDKLYEMFQRLDMERNRTIEGSGLGLAISYQLLQMMQGEISVDSVYGESSTFHVSLIQKATTQTHIEPFQADELKAIFRGAVTRRFEAPDAKILIVDDTPLNHTVMKELLKTTKIQIDSAYSGDEGLAQAEAKYYDLIFLDKKMPGKSGEETLKELRAAKTSASRRSTVISLSADNMPGMGDAERKSGYDDYLGKPVESEKLMETLVKYLPESKVFYS
ncbi:MAG: EAL domain-containing protein [Lachnospiraceae bacterium]|nr:EAL domain-containing protein [Lachnospiraceae bacterium]